jgi:uncharacterized protein YbbK (DUF523 family)
MYMVSACLAGMRTRYDGKDNMDERVKALVKEGKAIPVCPEQLAGLTTPRSPIEFRGGAGDSLLDGEALAVGEDGMDYSSALVKGAGEVMRIANLYGVREAVLKEGSPSCGVTYVFSDGKKVEGRGVVAELLARNGISVMTVDGL